MIKIIYCWYMRKMKNMGNILINFYTLIDQTEVSFMKKAQLRSQQNIT